MKDHVRALPWREGADQVLAAAKVPADHPLPMEAIKAALGPGPFALVLLFASPSADFAALTAASGVAYPSAEIIACTTAGEIFDGYSDGTIVAIGLPAEDFTCATQLIENVDNIDSEELIARIVHARASLGLGRGGFDHEFGMLLVDGLSLAEDRVAATLAAAMGEVPLVGGSAGDGTVFEQTWVGRNGVARRMAGVVALIATRCPVQVFSLDNMVPTDRRMVVTSADPDRRIVRTINAEPAAAEYARLVGKDPEQLNPLIFAAHPVVVRVWGKHHVRSIQRVTEAGELVFFSAIDEGLVLTVASASEIDMASHLDGELSALGAPAAILGFDCLLRRLDAAERQQIRAVSECLARHRVVGFSTYGEQIGPIHVNQTMTGVAVYPPVEP